MRNFSFVLVIISSAMLAITGCSSDSMAQKAALSDYHISDISVSIDTGIDLESLQPQDETEVSESSVVTSMLEGAIQTQVENAPSGGKQATLSVVLEELRVAELGDRTFGAVSELSGSVEVSDTETGEIIASTSITGVDDKKDEVLESFGGVFVVSIVAPVAVFLNSVDDSSTAKLQSVISSFANRVGAWVNT